MKGMAPFMTVSGAVAEQGSTILCCSGKLANILVHKTEKAR